MHMGDHSHSIVSGAKVLGQGVIVLVGGFMAPTSDMLTRAYWGAALDSAPLGWKVLVVHPSPVASLHDRACQIFYQLKGGCTKYGQAHAEKCGHAAYDEDVHIGLYPEWSEDNPVHFVAHSLGGNTVRLLLQLMREGDSCLAGAEGSRPTTRWVRSLTCISSPLNGAPAVYGLGGDTRGSALVRWGSGGFLLSVAIAAAEGGRAAARGRSGGVLDFGLGHFFRQSEGGPVLWRVLRFLWLLARFSLPWPLGASAKGRASLGGGFSVFSVPDNLAYDAQVCSI